MANKPVVNKLVGVLALQGDFKEHIDALTKLKVESVEVRTIEDLEGTDALIMPGGESTTIGKLLFSTGLDEAIIKMAKTGYPIYGTCAGAILLARMKLIDMTVSRNAYGRQLDSFDDHIDSDLFPDLQGVFIRAPRFSDVGKGVKILATYDNEPVLAQQDHILAGAFHPELTDDLSVHQYFLKLIK